MVSVKKFNSKLIAVLRGITPDEIIDVSNMIYQAGWGAIEVTLNSPDAFTSLQILHDNFKGKCLIGAGTVLTPDEVQKIAKIGLDFVISPNLDSDVIVETKKQGLISIPGIMTPSEAFNALKLGADALKIFPGECSSPSFVKAVRAVLPEQTQIFVTGGITPDNMPSFEYVGVNGFGIGGSLYKPNMLACQVLENAKRFCV